MSKPLKIDELREMIHSGKASDPLVFLESLMNGQDPRGYSDLYKLVMDINDFSDGDPSPEDWSEVVDRVNVLLRYKPVTLSESANAAKTLAEYLHAKRKQVETKSLDAEQGKPADLTKPEIKTFLKIFESEF